VYLGRRFTDVSKELIRAAEADCNDPEDEVDTFLRKVDGCLPNYTASQLFIITVVELHIVAYWGYDNVSNYGRESVFV
jgi:hypothetical protein